MYKQLSVSVCELQQCCNAHESPLEGKSYGLLKSPSKWDNLAPFSGWANINIWRVKEHEDSGWLLALINHTGSKERELEIERSQWVGGGSQGQKGYRESTSKTLLTLRK